MQVIETPRWEDYEVVYGAGAGGDGGLEEGKKNMWAFLGRGFTVEDRTVGADVSPYLAVEKMDPRWLEAVGSKGEE